MQRAIVDTYLWQVWHCPNCGERNELGNDNCLTDSCEDCGSKFSLVRPGKPKQLIRFFKAFEGATWQEAFILAEEWINDWHHVSERTVIEKMGVSEAPGKVSLVIMYRGDFD